MEEKFKKLITQYATEKELNWLESQKNIGVAFVASSRFISKTAVPVNTLYKALEKPLSAEAFWPLDRLVRIYFLLQLSPERINVLFDTAEINESVALYTSLPFLPNPEVWFYRATEAVRSNIGNIFEALAFENPYPSTYFTDLAWNQLVLKCIFNEKEIHKIEGLFERSNIDLALSISNLAHERWAAGRHIPALAWKLTIGFFNEQILQDIQRLAVSEREEDKIAAYLLSQHSNELTEIRKSLPYESKSWADLER